MIEVKLEDFEKYRANLTKYAKGLLYSKGFGNIKQDELIHKAKDIVQEAYLVFHFYPKDGFISQLHLKNFIKLCLYRSYQRSMNMGLNINKYDVYKEKELNKLIDNEHPLVEEYYDETSLFKSLLTEEEVIVLDYKLSGYNQVEIALKLSKTEWIIADIIKSIRERYLGIKISKEVIEQNRVAKIVEKSQKKVIQLDLEDKPIKTWVSGAIAAYELSLSASAISNCCKGKRKTHGNFKWKFNK